MTTNDIANTFFGIKNDAEFWDGWRTNGDRWALDYLADLPRGRGRTGGADRIAEADAALARLSPTWDT